MNAPLKQILVVEDDADNRSFIQELLQINGYNVISAGTAEEGLSLIRSHAFNLYLLDVVLPEKSGLDLCKQICQEDGHAPVVLFSAAAYETDRQAGLEAGAAAYFTKPADLEILLDTIDTLINKDHSS